MPMQPTTRMTRAQQRDRREKIAKAVTDKASIASVAGRFGVTLETVRAACRIYAPHKLAPYSGEPRTLRGVSRPKASAAAGA